jgi:hypothetical protein
MDKEKAQNMHCLPGSHARAQRTESILTEAKEKRRFIAVVAAHYLHFDPLLKLLHALM